MPSTSQRPDPTRPPAGPGVAELAEHALVGAAVLQGALLAAWLGLAPAMALRAGGFPPAPPFFVRWAGLLHLTLAVGYALEWWRARRVGLLVVAKGLTAAFLLVTWAVDGLPQLLACAVGLEAFMAAAGALLHGPAERSRLARSRLRLVPRAAPVRPAGRS